MKNEDNKIIVGSTFMNEPSEWGWKYGFTLNQKITRQQLHDLIPIIEQELNKKIKQKDNG